ncbi:hypothetical protein FRZ67_18115 [Panacibacter ginsenosidivorans]|uniref:Uncharacterized protein n=1 Tax=Panacibacter ginsenosidivorans TaxID=1813871 RepID=A0A5B8VDK3_9BACT|nr:hypothetical protein [Panacibacter ginsenosidivorans]QEC69135.1 hypothetical protein FRZ67_18115 [Panacibacter ginsenosidivorans]
MNSMRSMHGKCQPFYLEKWFMDVVSDEGEAFIFYAAKMQWRCVIVSYKSRLSYSPGTGKGYMAGFRSVQFPVQEGNTIVWKDPHLKVEGSWHTNTGQLSATLFGSEEDGLQWNCHHPSSFVKVKVGNKLVSGFGYAEQLILTVEPWKIPMDVLRWGRFISANDYLVWIEIKNDSTKQWVWYNGVFMHNAVITDDEIVLPLENIILKLDNSSIIESEKKINQVVTKLLRFIPGFKRAIPLNFLMADEYKWVSKGFLYNAESLKSEGWAIHERINF